jgi:hypothetical protein
MKKRIGSFDRRDTQIFATIAREVIVDLAVAGYGGAFIETRIVPPRMTGLLSKQRAAVVSKLVLQFAAHHIIIGFSSNSFPAAFNASRRFSPSASLQRHSQGIQQTLFRRLLAVDPRNFFDPADPPFPCFFNDGGIGIFHINFSPLRDGITIPPAELSQQLQ